MFTELKNALVDEFDGTGKPKVVLMDCELAAQNAIEKVFPKWSVHSCFFHFVKNVLDYAKTNGLSDAMLEEKFANWLKEILGKHFFYKNF